MEKLAFELRARSSPEQRCAFCHGGIGVSAMACLRCQTIFHEDCAAETGRCPTFGCREKPPVARGRTVEPWLQSPDASWWHALGIMGLWVRLLAVTTTLAMIGVIMVGVTIMLVVTISPASLVAALTIAIAYFAFQGIEGERRFQNAVRTALSESYPVVVRVFSTRDGDGPRVDLRAEGADPTERAPVSLTFGFRGPPIWLREARRLRIFGLSRPGPLVVEDGLGHRLYAPESGVLRSGPLAWRRAA